MTRRATIAGAVLLAATLLGCRGKPAPSAEPSREAPPEWNGPDAAAPDVVAPPPSDLLPDVADTGAQAPGADETTDGRAAPAGGAGVTAAEGATLAAGGKHACWIRPDRRVVCWGDNAAGQVTGRAGAVDGPRLVRGLDAAVALAAGSDCTCARSDSGRWSCWGRCAPSGAAADPGRLTTDLSWTDGGTDFTCRLLRGGAVECASGPVEHAGVENAPNPAVELAGTGDLACLREPGGGVRCWTAGSLVAKVDAPYGHFTAVELPGLTDAAELVSGPDSVCIRHGSGAVTCVFPGPPSAGDDRSPPILSAPVAIEDAVAVVAGIPFCALQRSGGVVCWPDPGSGVPDRAPDRIPTYPVAGVTDAVGLAVGEIGCAFDRAGRVALWELGGLWLDGRPHPLRARALRAAATEAAVVADVACVRRADGTVACGTTADEDLPPVPGVQDVVSVAGGRGAFCALSPGGRLRCWPSESPVPAAAVSARQGPATAERLAVVGGDICARSPDAEEAMCWSKVLDDSPAPTPRPSWLDDADPVVWTGSTSTWCGLLPDRSVRCGDFDGSAPFLLAPLAGSDLLEAAGWNRLCGRPAGDAVVCSTVAAENPHVWTVAGLDAPLRGLAGGDSALGCALLEDGTVRCWGMGGPGGRAEPVEGLADVAAIDVGHGAACAVLRSGEVRCWGARYPGGDAFRPPGHPSSRPLPVPGPAAARAVSVGGTLACARTAANEIWCWSLAQDRRLGWQAHRIAGLLDATDEPLVPAAPSSGGAPAPGAGVGPDSSAGRP